MSEAVLILGATSAIARATAAAFAAKGHALYLAARDMDELRRSAADLHLRYGVEVRYGLFDAELTETHATFLQTVIEEMQGLHGVVTMHDVAVSTRLEGQHSLWVAVRAWNLRACVIARLVSSEPLIPAGKPR